MTFPLGDELVIGLSQMYSPRLGLDPKFMGRGTVEFADGFEVSWITFGAPVQESTVKFLDGVGRSVVAVNVNGLGWTEL